VRFLPAAAPLLVDQLPVLQSPEDLQNVPALAYSNDRNPQEWHYTDPDGKTGVLRVTPKMSANNGDVLRELAIAGHGMINLPQFLHYEAVNRGLLQPLFANYIWANFDIFAVYPKTTVLPKRTRAFVDFMATLYGPEPYWHKLNPQ
jgi:DNA-binding transcriptional LysR family regulator